jgi:hypothetical protein
VQPKGATKAPARGVHRRPKAAGPVSQPASQQDQAECRWSRAEVLQEPGTAQPGRREAVQ